MRLIDADELIKDRVENDPVRIEVVCAPTVEVEPVRQWIPCKEKMPEDIISSKAKQVKVLVTIKNKNGYCVRSQTRIRYEYAGKYRWEWGKYTAGEIVAWMPLPEPYKEEDS